MKNKSSFLFVVVCCLYLLQSSNSFGLSTQLTYKIKGKSSCNLTLTFANAQGNTEVQPVEYINSSEIYFLLKPDSESSKAVFKEGDIIEILSKICIKQADKNVIQSTLPKSLFNAKGKIDCVIIAFSKEGFKDYNNFSFNVERFFSEKVNVGEKYFLTYLPQKSIYEQGLSKIEKSDFLGAYDNFMKIYENAKEKEEIQSFSFYPTMLNIEIPNIIDLLIKAEHIGFNQAKKVFQEEKSIDTYNSIKSVVKSASKNLEYFNPYLELEGAEVVISKNQIQTFLNTMSMERNKISNEFELERMLLFEQETYQNYKFSVFINLISKMLLYKNSIYFVEKLNPIDIDLLRVFPETRKELSGNLGDEFKFYVELINKNIEQTGFVFKREIMDNLWELRSTQRQPYFELISAFNSLNSDKRGFKDLLISTLTKSSDENFLDYIDAWLLSIRLEEEGINQEYLVQLNEGINLIQREQIIRADETFDILMRNAQEFAPIWFYAGKTKFALGEYYSAERFFKKALEIYPDYLAPRKFILKLYEENKNYSQLLENANYSINIMSAWFFHYERSVANYHLENYQEAITEITQECLKQNPWDTNQYFLLGDSYLAIKEYAKAKEIYEKTFDINPFSTNTRSFDTHMKVLYEKWEEVDEVK